MERTAAKKLSPTYEWGGEMKRVAQASKPPVVIPVIVVPVDVYVALVVETVEGGRYVCDATNATVPRVLRADCIVFAIVIA